MKTQAYVLALLTALIWGATSPMLKMGLNSFQKPLPALVIRFVGFLIFLFALIAIIRPFPEIAKAPLSSWLWLAGAGVVSIVGMLIYMVVLNTEQVSRAAPIAGVYPMFSFIIACLFMGESITKEKLIAVLLIMGGLILLK